MPTFSYAAVSVCIVKLSILISIVGFLCFLVIYVYQFTLIVFDIVILFNMKTFKKHPNKCAVLGTSLAGDIQQLLNSSGDFYHLTQTMDSEVFPLLWDVVYAWVNYSL